MYRILNIIVVCLLLIQNINASNTTNFKIEFPKTIDTKNIMIFFDDGLEQKIIDVSYEKNITVIKRNLIATYGTIGIMYPGKNNGFHSLRLLINSESGYVIFKDEDSTATPLSNYILKNAIDIYKCKEFLDLKEYCKTEFETNTYFASQYNLLKNDTSVNNYNNSSKQLALKALEYIKGRGDIYFYFWYFRLSIANELLKTNQLELYEVFNAAFPSKFKESFEGKNLKQLIEGNLFIKSGETSPLFIANDYKGNQVSSGQLKGKYVLISFWATWCGPCLAEIPMLQKIRQDYKVEELELISVSCDRDSAAFIKKIADLKMDWTNIFGNADMRNKFGNKPIPSLYLIDPNGIIRYSSWEDEEKKLHEILNNNLSHK
jgi:thiol-disulfide isomerase/thioredoxin